jgi:hypothetical protein
MKDTKLLSPRGPGQPTAYRFEYSAQVRKLVALGATSVDLASECWVVSQPDFREAVEAGRHDPEHLPALIRRLGWARRTAMQDNRNALLTLIEVIANDIAALRRLIAAGDLVAIKE